MIAALVHPASVQDRDSAPDVFAKVRYRWPWLRHVFADSGSAGDKLRSALEGKGGWTLDIGSRTGEASGFVVLPRRWVVERTFAWLGRSRRLAKDWEATISSSTAWLLIANARILIGRLAHGTALHDRILSQMG